MGNSPHYIHWLRSQKVQSEKKSRGRWTARKHWLNNDATTMASAEQVAVLRSVDQTENWVNRPVVPVCRSPEPATTNTGSCADQGWAGSRVLQCVWPSAPCPSHPVGTHTCWTDCPQTGRRPPSGSGTCTDRPRDSVKGSPIQMVNSVLFKWRSGMTLPGHGDFGF